MAQTLISAEKKMQTHIQLIKMNSIKISKPTFLDRRAPCYKS